MTKKQKKVLYRIIVSVMVLVLASFVPMHVHARQVLFLFSYFVIGYDILLSALRGVINLMPFDENFLMAVATIGAMVLSEHAEGVAVMLFYQIGELFQSIAVGKSRRRVADLMDMCADYANLVMPDGSIEKTEPQDIEVGSIIAVYPGEKVAIDAVVVQGKSSVDTSSLTGESVPLTVAEGDTVLSGSVNLSGLLKLRTTKQFCQSTASKILELVESAAEKKSRSENFISKFARYYTPAVCLSALALATLPPLFKVGTFNVWIYRALTFLVISCPCALVISIPLSFFACLGSGSKMGVLIKGSRYIETLSRVKTVVFDKTGTLTKGVFEVVKINGNEKTLYYAAHAECFSTHPIAKSIICAYNASIDKSAVENVQEISGKGVCATVLGEQVLVGNSRLMEQFGIVFDECSDVGSVAHVAVDGKYLGSIVISDVIKESSKAAVRQLKKCGVTRTVMLTGDSEATAENVAREIELDGYFAQLLPGDKVQVFESVMNGKTAFAGDGINDAPVLSRADVGIAMGGIGSDAAIEAADVVIMDDNPIKISMAIRLCKKCMAIVYQNILLAIGIKLLCLIAGAVGFAGMWAAIFADVGVMCVAVLNALRILGEGKVKEK